MMQPSSKVLEGIAVVSTQNRAATTIQKVVRGKSER